MTAAPITDNPLLHDLYRLPSPVLTAYLNAPAPGPGVDDTDLCLRALLDELRAPGATPHALRAIGSVLEPLRPGQPPAAAFVGVDGQTRMCGLPGAAVADQAHCGAVPHVMPMLHWRQRHPAFATVMLDRTGAELVCSRPAPRAPSGPRSPDRTT